MGQHAGTMDELAPGPQCAADRDTNNARPQPEHTGVGFSRGWQAGRPPSADVTHHVRPGAGEGAPADVAHAQWSTFPDRSSIETRTGIGTSTSTSTSTGTIKSASTSTSTSTVASIGGGAYARVLSQPAGARLYRVRKLGGEGEFATITEALAQWNLDKRSIAGCHAAVIELDDSGTYHEAPVFLIEPGEYLQLRAAHMARPVLRSPGGGQSLGFAVRGGAGSRFVMDGVMLAGGAIDIANAHPVAQGCAGASRFSVRLSHCTLVPGWDPDSMLRAPWRGHASITVHGAPMALRIEHCILGALRVAADTAPAHALELHVGDSIIDGGHDAALAISDSGCGAAMASADFCRVTVIGSIALHRLGWAENAVFLGAVLVSQGSAGCLSYCYLAPGSRTPLRTHCQPELAQQGQGADAESEALRVRPRYVSLRYGAPGYGQLAPDCAAEISCGADDGAGMGAMHHQHQASHMVAASSRQPYARA